MSKETTKPRNDPQLVELRGRNWLTSQLLQAGLEVARPERDRGIDLIAYRDIDEKQQFLAYPIQMKLCSYVVKYDHGFAPNPYWDYCTVACCKGRYRKNLKEGDWLVGTSSKTRHGTGTRLIYAMQIAELLSFGHYSSDSRFRAKIPRYGQIEQRGDNIYHLDGNGVLRQSVPSYHSRGMNSIGHGLSDRWVLTGPWEEHEGRKAKDLNGMLVPISASGNFWYFG